MVIGSMYAEYPHWVRTRVVGVECLPRLLSLLLCLVMRLGVSLPG